MSSKNNVDRRDFIKHSGLALMAASLPSVKAHYAFGQTENLKTINIGVIGTGSRGRNMTDVLLQIPGINVPAICDISQVSLDRCAAIVEKRTGKKPQGYTKGEYDYRRLLERDDLDGVMIATPVEWHVRMSVDAMNAGKDVGCEVTAGDILEELWELVRTKEKTGRHYMLLENYNYDRDRMMVTDMIKQTLFGEPYYAECGYIHDCKHLLFNSDGSLTWRGERATIYYDHPYATHSLGPVCKWMGINDGDRLEYLTTMVTKPRMIETYAAEKFGSDSELAKIDYKRGDFYTTTIHTVQGKVIRLDFDAYSNRPRENYYLVQGTNGIYNSRSGIFLKGDKEKYQSTSSYRAKYEHPYWKQSATEAAKTGHGGGDYFVLRDFVKMIREDKEPWIDVYDAATWSCISHCSKLSLDGKSAPIEMPDFTSGKWKEKNWREQFVV